jgi:molybdopterin converting factor subunit 1
MRILFFAQLREVAGATEAELEADGVDAVALWELLVARWPSLTAHRAQTRLARNGVYARVDEVFAEGDEVALIPPVSGG